MLYIACILSFRVWNRFDLGHALSFLSKLVAGVLDLNENANNNVAADGPGEATHRFMESPSAFRQTRQAMTSIGISRKEQNAVFKILSALLHLRQVIGCAELLIMQRHQFYICVYCFSIFFVNICVAAIPPNSPKFTSCLGGSDGRFCRNRATATGRGSIANFSIERRTLCSWTYIALCLFAFFSSWSVITLFFSCYEILLLCMPKSYTSCWLQTCRTYFAVITFLTWIYWYCSSSHLEQLCPTRGPVEGFVRPSLGFRCGKSILHADKLSLLLTVLNLTFLMWSSVTIAGRIRTLSVYSFKLN